MAAGMSVDLERGLRILVFGGRVAPTDLDFIGKLYLDREHFRLGDREIAYFTPDVSLAGIDTEDLGALADSYSEAMRSRDGTFSRGSVWVMPDQVRGEARLWREFTRDSAKTNRRRSYVDSLAAALAALGLADSWLDDIRHARGFLQFGDVSPLATAL